ncbi:B3/B4 tRNA-binding domain-containing protein [Viridothelium virens]|uniref:B3/B4 tRNA-binding domain-containing protein n=1 Tax=Viridothelium virens TaxID=1048519 RepID=A0A6A6GY66_VIRVR|nr:B3/B4 tRNA-binding domain-containing protein [Viridothelium virens]
MTEAQRLQSFLDGTRIAPEVFGMRPDYRALLIIVHGIPPGPSDSASETLMQEAEASARTALTQHPVTEIPHVASWREAYKSFGAKPQRTRNSLESLMRRAEGGLPRINRLTDIYNAISIKHQIPLGGENVAKYVGSPFLIRATGQERFETTAGGENVVEFPDPGEVVWCDNGGVTCRRWNWRQCSRTALTDETTCVLFILDALEPVSTEALVAAADELALALQKLSPDVQVLRRIFHASG